MWHFTVEVALKFVSCEEHNKKCDQISSDESHGIFLWGRDLIALMRIYAILKNCQGPSKLAFRNVECVGACGHVPCEISRSAVTY